MAELGLGHLDGASGWDGHGFRSIKRAENEKKGYFPGRRREDVRTCV